MRKRQRSGNEENIRNCRVPGAEYALLTPDDLARLHPDFVKESDPDHEKQLTGQARPNVLFETGMALASHPDRTILVEIGQLRPFSDVAGRHSVKFDGSPSSRPALAERLRTAKCAINASGQDWLTVGDFQITSGAVPHIFATMRPTQKLERSPGWLDKATEVECIDVQLHAVEESDGYLKLIQRDSVSRGINYSTDAVLAAFRISDNSPSKYAKLTARIDFVDDKGTRVQRVDCGTWVAEPSHEVSISASATLYLVIAVRDRYKAAWNAVDNNPVQFKFFKKTIVTPCKAKVTLLIHDHPMTYPEMSLPLK